MARIPKQIVTVELPTEFTEFMRHVNQLILTGDEAVTMESDDLLQCDCVYGGLYDVEQRQFGFRYFQSEKATWDVELTADQIGEIATGTLVRLGLWQCAGARCGCLYPSEDAYCMHCDSIRHFDDYESRLRFHHPDADPTQITAMINLRKIGLAILDYHRENGRFPPQNTYDPGGRPMHSWRSLILPYLDEESVYEMIDFCQPWNSDANRQIWDHRPEVYHRDDCSRSETAYLAIVGEDTVWPFQNRRQFSDIKSGTSYTVLAVSANETMINWMQPADIDVDTALSDYTSRRYLLAVFADGHVDEIQGVDIDELRALICIE